MRFHTDEEFICVFVAVNNLIGGGSLEETARIPTQGQKSVLSSVLNQEAIFNLKTEKTSPDTRLYTQPFHLDAQIHSRIYLHILIETCRTLLHMCLCRICCRAEH